MTVTRWRSGLRICVFDYQINGALGIDFGKEGLTKEEVLRVARWLGKQGIQKFFACIVTRKIEILLRNVAVIAEASRDRTDGIRIAGIHLEGPVISEKNGPRGAHPLQHVRDALSHEEWQRLRDAAEGRIRLVSLAPERKGAIDFIRMLREDGVRVGNAHTDANETQLDQAAEAGASIAIHFGNAVGRKYGASSQLVHRHNNPMWDQLGDDRLFAGAIPDSHHLPLKILMPLLRTKGKERVLYTTDLAPVAGLEPGPHVEFDDIDVVLHESGLVTMPGSKNLAGSACTPRQNMNWLWENSARLGYTSFDEIVRGWWTYPLAHFGLEDDIDSLPGPFHQFDGGTFYLTD